MKILINLSVFVAFLLTATADSESDDKINQPDSVKAVTESTTEILTTNDAGKSFVNATELFYNHVKNTLDKQSNLMAYARRVDCIMNSLRDLKVFDTINKTDYNITYTKNNGTMAEIHFQNFHEVMDELTPAIESANTSCMIPGLFSVTLIIIVVTVLITCLVFVTRGDQANEV